MSTTKKEWPCTVAGCTADDRACLRMIGYGKGKQPKEKVQFIKSELVTMCAEAVTYLASEQQRLQVELAIRNGQAALEDKDGNEVTPEVIAKRLMEYVRGQDYAIKRISRSLYYFLLAREIRKNPELLKQFDLQPEQLPKLNMMMPGPTGSGKTYIWEQVQRLTGIPVCIVSVTDVTSSGYVGASLEDKLADLLEHVVDYLQENGNPKADIGDAAAYLEKEGAILVLDEIDKKASPQGGENNSSGRDISGTSVQQELLTFVQGTTVRVAIGAGMQKQEIPVNTRLILFAAMGAFTPPKGSNSKPLKAIVLKEKSGGNFEGADTSEKAKAKKSEREANYARYATDEHFIEYGFMPELLGRLMACYAPLNELSEEDMYYILTQVRGNRYAAYRALFAKRGLRLEITDDALHAIAQKAKKSNLNARALDNVLSALFVEVDMVANDRAKAGNNYLYISKKMVDENGAIIEEGEDVTFQKRESTEVLEVESDGVDDE